MHCQLVTSCTCQQLALVQIILHNLSHVGPAEPAQKATDASAGMASEGSCTPAPRASPPEAGPPTPGPCPALGTPQAHVVALSPTRPPSPPLHILPSSPSAPPSTPSRLPPPAAAAAASPALPAQPGTDWTPCDEKHHAMSAVPGHVWPSAPPSFSHIASRLQITLPLAFLARQ